MAKFARLDEANIVVELFEHETILPSETHIPEIAAQFIECPDFVTLGAMRDGDTWAAPTPAAPVAQQLPLLSPIAFYLAFKPAERIAVKTSTDPLVSEFWSTYQLAVQLNALIDPNLASVRDGLAYLAQPKTAEPPGAGILSSPERVHEILIGTPQ